MDKINIAKLKAGRLHPRDNSTDRQSRWTDNDGSAVRGRTDGWTDRQTDSQTLPITLSPSLHGR